MDKQHAQQLLGLSDNASPAEVAEALAVKRSQISQKRDAAPTDALKAKFDQLLSQLNEAEAALKAAPKASPLSQTKLADLPSMAPGDAEQLALQPGQMLAGRYKIEELLGQGGMGAVYRAFDTNRDEDIAIKLLLPSLAKNERARERFMNEARLSSRLSHPNIVNVFDVQKDGDLVFLTMELLEGQDLRALMDNNRTAGQQFLIDDIKDIVEAVSQALANAHEITVHRDIKPENIWFGSDGKIKLMDFGIAQVQSTSQRTKTGAAMGTAYYMAPEQLKGLSDIDGRADQYAVAVMAYELLTGEVPAGAIEPVQDLRKDVPPGMAKAIMQALSPRPENRFADMAAFNAAFQSGKSVKQKQAKSKSLQGPGLPWPAIAAGVLVVVLLGGLVGTGTLDLKSLIPASKEEIAAQKAQVAKVQGEIKVLKQRLENGRRQLDSDLKDAQRNKATNVDALAQWQQLTENAIFSGSQLTELEGDYAMAETLLRDNVLEQAQAGMNGVRDGYRALLDNFNVAESLWSKQQANIAAETRWQQLTQDYQLTNPPAVLDAQQSIKQAIAQQRMGEFVKAGQAWDEAAAHWQAARLAALTGKLVSIPAGSFMMGSNNGRSDEKPVHRVSIKAFKMMEHEVTFALWDACVQAGGCSQKPDDRGWGRGTRPVIYVSWNDITQQFIPWLNKATGKTFRLPTEAEWEYAARAGSSSKYSWGDDVSCSQARYGRWEQGACINSKDGTVPVKSFAPNAYGLYDMHGNVWEWVQDCWNESYSGAPTKGSAWQSGDCGKHVLRGGSWYTGPDVMRSAARVRDKASIRYNIVGFRLVQDL